MAHKRKASEDWLQTKTAVAYDPYREKRKEVKPVGGKAAFPK